MLVLWQTTDIDQIKCIGTPKEPQYIVRRCPVYYHGNILEVWLTLKALLLKKVFKRTQNLSGPFSQNGCHNTQQLQISTTSFIVLLQSSFGYQNNLQGLQFSKWHTSQNTQNATEGWFCGRGSHLCCSFRRFVIFDMAYNIAHNK